MKKTVLIFTLIFIRQLNFFGQCNQGLNLGAVVVPTHSNSSNNGNFGNTSAWQEAATWVDNLNLDYRQRYISWTDVVQQINSSIPTFSSYYNFENLQTTWAGNCNVHIIYPAIKVESQNTTMAEPSGFVSAVDSTNSSYFSDTAYVNQNYLAIKHILQNVNNVKWISVGNEIDTYFKNAYWGTGRLTRFTALLDTIRNRMNVDGFSNVKLGSVVTFHNLTWSGNYDIIDSIRSHVDFVGYTFYYTSLGSPNDNCWGDPATVSSWLNIAKAEVGSKKMMITETCMGDGGGVTSNCGSPAKQLAYADTLLNWYNTDTSKIIGMTWFTIVDPYLGWQTPSTLWNTSGLVDSNGVTLQSAGTLWQHECTATGNNEILSEKNVIVFPNPTSGKFFVRANGELTIYNLPGEIIYKTKLNSEKVEIDISHQPKGTYFIQLQAKDKFSIKRIIIQ